MDEQTTLTTIQPIAGKVVSDITFGLDDPDIIEAEIVNNEEDWMDSTPAFMESNTQAITLDELETKCIVPCFATNELTLSHQEIAKNLYMAAAAVFGPQNLGPLEFRVSHPISGRVGKTALTKEIDQLTDSEKSLWFQRIACCFTVKSLKRTVCGQETYFCIGFVRSYHTTNLYSTKSAERVTLFCGTRVKVCSNLALNLRGLKEDLLCLSGMDVREHALRLLDSYSVHAEEEVQLLEDLGRTNITIFEFKTLIGSLRYYQALGTEERKALGLPKLDLGDQLCNEATRLFVNSNWGLQEGEKDVNLFRVLQCFTDAAKGSYIHNFLQKNAQCTELVLNIQKVLQGDHANPYAWFLS